jgi:hypothetical protein
VGLAGCKALLRLGNLSSGCITAALSHFCLFAIIVANRFLKGSSNVSKENEILINDLVVSFVTCDIFCAHGTASTCTGSTRDSSAIVVVKAALNTIKLSSAHSAFVQALDRCALFARRELFGVVGSAITDCDAHEN